MHLARPISTYFCWIAMWFSFMGDAAAGGDVQPKSPKFQGLGIPPGQEHSYAKDVSNDGSVVVGTSRRGTKYTAFRWTANERIVSLGVLPGETQSSAEGVSADGSVIIGFTPSSSTGQAFRWTHEEGFVGLGQGTSSAMDVSGDGSIVVGGRSMWPPFGERTVIPVSVGHNGVTPDGSLVVGYYTIRNRLPARWTAEDGVRLLGDLPGGYSGGLASGVSPDGSVIVGWSSSYNSRDEAFRWTSNGGMIGLGDLPGGEFQSMALDVSADGSTIVGWGISGLGEEAFYWQPHSGMRPLRDVLVDDYGLDLGGWSLNHALAISPDGTVIVGNGTNPAGSHEGWIAVVPEPGTLGLAAIGAASMGLVAASGGFKRRTSLARRVDRRRLDDLQGRSVG